MVIEARVSTDLESPFDKARVAPSYTSPGRMEVLRREVDEERRENIRRRERGGTGTVAALLRYERAVIGMMKGVEYK